MFLCFFAGNFAYAGIVLKIVGANPSSTARQTVTLKAYLPKEIKPEHVLSKEDLDVVYDTQLGSYYVYGEYELEPKGVVEKEIEIKDIWFIDEADLETLRLEAIKTAELLEGTDFRERADFLKRNIESKLDRIIDKQKTVALNPQKHISQYRDNLKLLESVKENLLIARSLLSKAKPLATTTVWKIFVVVLGFLAVLGLSLYFIWQRQAKVMGDLLPSPEDDNDDEAPREGPQARHPQKDQDNLPEDIEKIIEKQP